MNTKSCTFPSLPTDRGASAAALLRRAFVSAASRVSEEVSANFQAWYTRNFVNPRAGRIGSASYLRAGELDERPGDQHWYADAYERALVDHTEPLRPDEFAFILQNPLVALQLAVGVTDLRGLRCLRRGLTQGVNRLQAKAYRSRYYARDNERRRRLAAERRRIRRRRTLNPCPTPEAFRAAFARRADSIDARILFGGLVHDLECYVDNCLRFDANGEIVGRNGGVKAWIAENVPELAGRYKTIMRYKALAKRVRQVAEIKDPVPTDVLLPLAGEAVPSPGKDADKAMPHDEIYYARKSHLSETQKDGDGSKDVRAASTGCEEEDVRRDENYYAQKSHLAQERERVREWERERTLARERILARERTLARERVCVVLSHCTNTLKGLFSCLE